MATALGQRLLDGYALGTFTAEQLQAAVAKGWISQAEYDQAVASPPQS